MKFSAEFDKLSFFFLKTKAVWENANWRRSEPKEEETGQDPARSPKKGLFNYILIVFHFLRQKDWQ